MSGAAKIFFSYSHADEKLRDKLVKQLDVLRENGQIETWSDTDIDAGDDWNRKINVELDVADIILLLVSDDFLASPYIKSVEIKRAIERDRDKTARVVPVILRDCDWKNSVIGRFQALPKNGSPVKGRRWSSIDEALLDVVRGIQKLLGTPRAAAANGPSPAPRPVTPRPSDPMAVDPESKYARFRVSEIVKSQLLEAGFNIENLNLDAGMHARDLEVFCRRIFFPKSNAKEIRDVIQNARAVAFTAKYVSSDEDEKLVKPASLGIKGIKPWHQYLKPVLKKVGLNSLKERVVLDVGAGNGRPYAPAYSDLKSIEIVDISARAIEKFKANLPYLKVKTHANAAEYLEEIPTGSVELYLSFRTYQSSLFDRRAAVREAFRVLQRGGAIILSIPVMFLRPGRKPLVGLIPPGSTKPSMAYAKHVVDDICGVLNALNFQKVGVDDISPFEHYIHAVRPA